MDIHDTADTWMQRFQAIGHLSSAFITVILLQLFVCTCAPTVNLTTENQHGSRKWLHCSVKKGPLAPPEVIGQGPDARPPLHSISWRQPKKSKLE